MKEVIAYHLLESSSAQEMTQTVNENIKIGWQPVGAAIFNPETQTLFQTLVLYSLTPQTDKGCQH